MIATPLPVEKTNRK